MFVIVAGRNDPGAATLARCWAADGAAVLSCEDLSTRGWRHFPDDPAASRAVIGGTITPLADIRGAVVRRSWVFPHELSHVAAEDRDYVAAEMSAFLLAWLTDLPCPVFNTPTASCLCGPGWSPALWARAARRCGIAAPPSRFGAPDPAEDGAEREFATVNVIDGLCIDSPDPAMADAARRLAAFAGVRWLAARFAAGGQAPTFVGASALPEPGEPAAARLREAFLSATA